MHSKVKNERHSRLLKDGKALISNDPATHPDRIGLPVGHPQLRAFLGVPLKREGRTIGLLAVGNREGGYANDQLESLEALAPTIVEAFLRKRAEHSLEVGFEPTRILKDEKFYAKEKTALTLQTG